MNARSPKLPRQLKVGYVLKRYPRYSETFVVNEILAHEAVGLEIEIFSLYPMCDTHFQDSISRVRAPVRYLLADGKMADFWNKLQTAAEHMPYAWSALEAARGEDAREVYQALMLATAVKQNGINHLHAHFATSASTVARLAARFAHVPFTMTAHAKDIFHEEVNRDDLRRKLDEAAATVTVSDFNLRYLQDTFGDSACRVQRLYNGMDLSLLNYSSPADREPLIVSVGRLVEKKGFADLIRACGILKHSGTEFACQIVGTGEEASALRALISELDLRDCVELCGPRPQREVFELIQRAAVFAAPCVVGGDGNRDGLPTVLLEAMALGTPCISTDVTGIPEVIRHCRTGLIVGQHNPAELASSIRALLSDRATRQRLSQAARTLIEEQFDVARNAAQLRSVFAAAVANRGAAVHDIPANEALEVA